MIKEIIVKYTFIFLTVLAVVVPGSIFLTTLSGCVSVQYKELTPSTKCNLIIMLIKLKGKDGLKAFEISKYLEECFDDLEHLQRVADK